MKIGEKVRFIRKSNELNQKEFAIRIGVSQGTLSDIERGVCLPSCETIIVLRSNFNCDINWIITEDVLTSPPIQTTVFNDELKLLNSIRSLPAREKDELLEIIQGSRQHFNVNIRYDNICKKKPRFPTLRNYRLFSLCTPTSPMQNLQ